MATVGQYQYRYLTTDRKQNRSHTPKITCSRQVLGNPTSVFGGNMTMIKIILVNGVKLKLLEYIQLHTRRVSEK